VKNARYGSSLLWQDCDVCHREQAGPKSSHTNQELPASCLHIVGAKPQSAKERENEKRKEAELICGCALPGQTQPVTKKARKRQQGLAETVKKYYYYYFFLYAESKVLHSQGTWKLAKCSVCVSELARHTALKR